ncbi:MAG: hypothetical protein C0508_02630 [Cyanobacteria bacterium PR.023]|nr:hypothetical protein [Cyanobacteria bacterium PR.023]
MNSEAPSMGKDCSLDSVGQNYNDHSISPILSEVMEELHRSVMSFPCQRNDGSHSQGARNFGHSSGSIDFGDCENIYEASRSSEPAKNSLLDKFEEVLLDIERAIRASDRGSARMAREWMHEAAADLQDLGAALEPSSLEPSSAATASETGSEAGSETCEDCQPSPSAAADSGAQVDLQSDATEPPPESDASYSLADSSKPVTGSVDEVLAQNDRNQNSVFPGENTDRFGWYGGRAGAGIDKPTTPDSRFNYLMAWNMVYPEKGKQANPEARVEMQNFRTYVHTKDGNWLEVLNQNNSGIGGGLSDADFADMYAVYDAPISNSEDGVASFKAPPPGFNFQPWISGRGGFDNQNIDGIYVSGMVRSDRPDSNLVIDQGADWYAKQDGTAVGLENSDGIGTSNWLRLSDRWQPLFYSTVGEEELRRNPPPGIVA